MSAKDNGNVSRPLGAEASTAKDSVATAEEKMEKAQAQAPESRRTDVQSSAGDVTFGGLATGFRVATNSY